MTKTYDDFIKSIENENTARVARSFDTIGKYDFDQMTFLRLENLILSMKPQSPKTITTIVYIINLYAKYLGNENLSHMTDSIDRKALWAMAKADAPKKFISHSEYENVLYEVGLYEEYNAFYYQTLFMAIYEGVYSDSLDVLKNLRESDIDGNVLTLRKDDGTSYKLEVSEKLASNMRKLSKITLWERRNRWGTCSINMTGAHEDSCFRVELRKIDSEYSYRFAYYRCLRKISNDYFERKILPLDIFISGIMHRIKENLDEAGIGLEEAFSSGNKNRTVSNIISAELERCGYNIPSRNFRELVIGHLDTFER